MWSEKYASPLLLELRPSKIALVVTLFMHGGGILLLTFTTLSTMCKLALAMAVVGSFGYSLMRLGWLTTEHALLQWVTAYQSACWHDTQWVLQDIRGVEQNARLLPSSFVHRWLTVVNLQVAELPWYRRHVSLLILPDNIDQETFRRLRVRLRWYPSLAQDNSAESK